ncbi:MAG: amidohydrolase [Deltaproteobacteria bacterium]|nr:amidohydrolase [Deltaproteobacteria bacterium]
METQTKTGIVRAIDIHHHYFPPGLVDEVSKHGKALGVEASALEGGQVTLSFAGKKLQTLEPGLLELDQRLTIMDKGKVALAAVEANTGSLGYPLDGEKGESWCRLYNQGLKDLVEQKKDRFTAMAAVPMQDPPRAAKVLESAIRDLKLSGAMISTNCNGQYYHGKEFEPFWAKAQELDALVVMHPDNVAGTERMGAMRLRLVCGNPADTTLSLGYLIYGGVFDRFPDLKICVLHGGGFFPYHLGRFDHGFDVQSGAHKVAASSSPHTYLKNLYFDTLVYRVDTLDYLRRIVGSAHLMVGTDYPYDLGDWMGVEKVEALDCKDSDKQLILQDNARKLLKLQPNQ